MQNACDDSEVRRRVTEELDEVIALCEVSDPPSFCDAFFEILHELLIEYLCEHYAS